MPKRALAETHFYISNLRLSGVYEWAIATGVLPLNANPIRSAVKGQGAKWTVKVSKPCRGQSARGNAFVSFTDVVDAIDIEDHGTTDQWASALLWRRMAFV